MSNQFPGTGLLDPPPDSNNPEHDLAKAAKRLGMTRDIYMTMRMDAIRLTGRVLHWKTHQYDEAVDALRLIAEEVWGTRH